MVVAFSAAMSTKKRKNKPRRVKKASPKKRNCLTALAADPLRLYEESVQNTESSIELIDRVFEHEGKSTPLKLREDFCGTARLCCDWVRSHKDRVAVGVDIDNWTINWAKKNNIELLGESKGRVTLLEQDVLNPIPEPSDVIVAFNFSYWVFQRREVLKSYFGSVLKSLEPGGVFIIDMHGGPDSQFILEEETEHDNFIYVWDQESFDPINNHVICHIHFRFFDDTELKRAFSYDWRIWSMPELRELLKEVGFSKVDSWWDDDDDVIRPRESAENLVSWIGYLVAWR